MEAGQLLVSGSRTQLHTSWLVYPIDLPSTFWTQDLLNLPRTLPLSLPLYHTPAALAL